MSRTQRLLVVLALNLALVAALMTVGVTAHSLAVLAAGGDYLLDAVAVGVALLAIRLSAPPAKSARRAGSPNASSIAALINGGWLLVLEVLVASAAVDRLINGTPQVHGLPVLVVSGIAALVMAGGALVLRGDGDDDEGEDEDEDEAGQHAGDLGNSPVPIAEIPQLVSAQRVVAEASGWRAWWLPPG